MALSWTMDKIGPITRSVEDAALVLWAIHGADGRDNDALTAPWILHAPDELKSLSFGFDEAAFAEEYDDAAFDAASLDAIRELGVELQPITLPDLPVGDMLVVLEVEAAAAFDQLTRSNRDDELVRQVADAWPNVFRAAQLVPGVQYVQAQRARTLLQRAWQDMLAELDGFVCPAFAGRSLLDTNLTGNPCVVLPNGFREDGTPTSITFIGRNYGEGAIVALAAAYQRATGFHLRHPELLG
jgi:Asp-tRNA(Asn)/Glu-tRNA(Gln) amidotransferase A subunit family amidase